MFGTGAHDSGGSSDGRGKTVAAWARAADRLFDSDNTIILEKTTPLNEAKVSVTTVSNLGDDENGLLLANEILIAAVTP